jgi:hypothetical protein
MRLWFGLVLALASTAALSYGFFLQHAASGKLPTLALRHPLKSLTSLFTCWRWLAGFIAGLTGWALYILALRFAPLSLVQATSAGGVGLLALLVRLGGGQLSRHEYTAVLASVAGLALLGLSLPAGTGNGTSSGWQLPLGWALVSMLLAAVAAGPLAPALRPGAGLGAAAGLLYSAGDVATKALMAGSRPALLFAGLLLLCHGLAFVALQLAFQRGTALATAGVSTLLTNALPIIAGLAIFAEQMPAGPAGLLRGLGFTGAVVGATLLASAGPARQPAPETEVCSPSRRGSPEPAPGPAAGSGCGDLSVGAVEVLEETPVHAQPLAVDRDDVPEARRRTQAS